MAWTRRRERRGGRRTGRHRAPWYAALLVLALVAGVASTWRTGPVEDLRDRLLGGGTRTSPAAVAPPPGLDLPAVDPPAAVAPALAPALAGTAPASATPDRRAVRRALLPALRDPDLGRRVLAVVADLATGETVVRKGTGVAVPASTTKLLTAAAALETLGPEHTFATRVVAGGAGGAGGAGVVLVGGGDPFLERAPADPTDAGDPSYPPRADLATLARQTAEALRAGGTTTVAVGYDTALFAGPAVNDAWPADYVPDGVVSPITSLWTDEGRERDGTGRVADPALAAAEDFAAALAAAGIVVTGPPTATTADPAAPVLGEVRGAPLREVVQRVLESSDNEASEVLAHQVALARGLTGSFVDGATAVGATLTELGVATAGLALFDGSGLSRRNRVAPDTLTALLRTALDPAHPRLASLVPGLPVAGFSGSLTDRFAGAPAVSRGVVRAKTGTLTGVSSLAGTVVDADGRVLAFAIMADRVDADDEVEAEAALDRAAGALAACACG